MSVAIASYQRLRSFRVFLIAGLLAAGLSPALAAPAATSTTLAITSSGTETTSVASGTVVTLTATVKAGATAVQLGQVNFCDAAAAHCTGIHLLGTAQLAGAGTAALKFVPAPGSHSYKAEFAGTTTDAASASSASALTVEIPTTTAIAQSGSTGNYTLKATVVASGAMLAPTGTVSFLDTSANDKVLGTATLSSAKTAQSWSNAASPTTKPAPQSIAVADFNGDGITDIAIGTAGTSATSSVGYINLLLGNGNGTFQTAKAFAALADNQAIIATPFTNGGPQDILTVSNSSTATNNALILTGDGKGGFTAGTPFSLGGVHNVSSLIAGDFSGDGKQDFIIAGEIFGEPVFDVYLGNGNGTFNAGTLNATVVAITALGAGDFTGSGALDLATVGSDGSVQIWGQDGLGDFFPGASASAGKSPTAIVIGDFNGDGKADLAITNGGDDNVSILLGNGNGTFTAEASPSTGKTPSSIAIGDFNGDGIADLAVANSGDNTITILLGKGDGIFTAQPPLAAGTTPYALAAGNFSGHGNIDLAIANQGNGSQTATTGNATVWLSELTGTASAAASNIAPAGSGTHLVEASFPADDDFAASVSGTTILSGTASPAATPILSPAAGTYTSAQSVKLTDSTTGATIYYTTNGTTPTTASIKYTAAITVSATETIEAIAVAAGYTNSAVASAKYTIETPAATPVFSVAAGTYASAQSVKLTDTTAGAVIYYTINGTIPTTASTKYTAAITVSATETIEAIAVSAGYNNSAVASAKYTIETPAATPIFSVAAGTYASAQSVKLTDTTAGAVIYYTINGTIPTTASTKYTAAITVSATETIEAIAVAAGYNNSAVASAKYIIETPATTPTFSVAAGTYASTQSVKLIDATAGAVIYYTTNGTIPTTASTKYTAAIAVSATETIKAIAAATGHTNSAVASAAYVIETPTATPVISPSAGTYTSARTITITDASLGATIYYTTNGTTPTVASTKYTAAIAVTSTETIKAMAVASGHAASAVATAAYVIETPAATPAFSVAAGTYATAQSVKITDTTAGAVIYYTTNGTTPTTASTKYTAAIAVSATETIKAIAVATGYINSAVASATYTIEKPAATPAFSVAAGTYTTAQTVAITDTTVGAVIYYTTNGSTPTTASTKYAAAIPVAATETVKAIAVATGYINSAVASATYTIEKPAATPAFSIAAGTYATAQSVTITDATAGAVIYYTTNGAAPTTASTKYTSAIAVSTTEIVKAIAVATGYTNSGVATAQYTIGLVATPAFSLAAGTYTAAQSVTITDATAGATIYYTTNGAIPTPSSTKYTAAIPVSASETIEAIAVATGLADSKIAEATYDIGANITAIPVLSPLPGAYSTPRTVTITDATPGAVITYTTGIGSTTNTYTYTGPFTVSSTEYIAFDAIAPGYTRSPASEVIYTIGQVPAPVFTPAAGTYGTAQAVNIIDQTPSATIFYTTDGSAPTAASAIYTGPIIVSSSETIHALAVATGVPSSLIASAAYTIGKGVATPAFSVPAGSYTTTQSVGITDITPGATIYYTTNGTAPTTASTKYTTPIAVSTSETVEAIAVATGYTNSAIATAAYTIGYPIETFAATASGNGVVTVPVGGQSAFVVAASNGSSQSFPSITVSTSTGSNPSLPVVVTLCQTNPSTGQCLAAPAPTVTLTSFAPGANASFSVFATATAAIANNPANQIYVLFKNPGGTVEGSTNVAVDTN